MSGEQLESVEGVLEKYIPGPELEEVKRVLYGKPSEWVWIIFFVEDLCFNSFQILGSQNCLLFVNQI